MPDIMIIASIGLLTLVVATAVFLGFQANQGVKNFRAEKHVGFETEDSDHE